MLFKLDFHARRDDLRRRKTMNRHPTTIPATMDSSGKPGIPVAAAPPIANTRITRMKSMKNIMPQTSQNDVPFFSFTTVSFITVAGGIVGSKDAPQFLQKRESSVSCEPQFRQNGMVNHCPLCGLNRRYAFCVCPQKNRVAEKCRRFLRAIGIIVGIDRICDRRGRPEEQLLDSEGNSPKCQQTHARVDNPCQRHAAATYAWMLGWPSRQ